MAQLLIRQAHGGQYLTIDDAAWPYFESQRYVVIDTVDDSSDSPPLYLSASEADLRYVQTAGIGDATHPDGAELREFFELKVDRTGATTGQIPTLQADGSMLFTSPAGTAAASETVAGTVELATAAETTTGTDNTRAVHPAGLKVELDKKAPLRPTRTTQTGTTYTFVVGDANTMVEGNNASAITFTVPQNTFTAEDSIAIRQVGVGQITVAAGTGTTRQGRGSAFKTAGQWAEATITFRTANEFVVSGDVTA